MSQGIKIIQLLPVTSITDNDNIPLTRGGLETYRIPAGIFVTNGFNIGAGSGQFFAAKTNNTPTTLQFRTLSANGETLSVSTVGNTVVVSASGSNPVKRAFIGDGTTISWPLTPTFNSVNAANYRVDIDGVLQEAFIDYSISNNNIIFATPPLSSSKIVIVSSNVTPLTEAVVSPNSVTTDMLIDGTVTPVKLSTGSPTWNSAGTTTVDTLSVANIANFNTTITNTLSVQQSFYYPPDYDSGWFNMSSQAGANSYTELNHNLGQYPAHVKVLTRAIDGNNNGFIFEGMGSAQHDDEGASESYGGLIFAYNQTKVRLWAPDVNNGNDFGRIIFVSDGWGGEINTQESQTAQVRVLAWKGFYDLT